MAKKKASGKRPKQVRIAGTYDEVPKVVQDAADEYVEAKREVASWREKMNGRKDQLIELMQEHDVKQLDIDDGDKRIILEDEARLKIKKKSDPKPGSPEAAEAEAAFS